MIMKKRIASYLVATTASVAAFADQVDIVGPQGSSAFGTYVATLANGNVIVTDPGWPNGQHWGAVYLLSPIGAVISTFTGDTDHHVGGGGIVALKTGNFFVLSLGGDWSSCGGGSGSASATYINGSTGLSGTISCNNSLVGFHTDFGLLDNSLKVVPLSNGNHVIQGPYAAAWVSGSDGSPVGAVSPSNSFQTSSSGKLYPLGNGNYVITDALWSNGASSSVGAATWANGSTGLVGVASTANSLVGSQPNDQVGSGGIVELSNGNYVVMSPNWNNGAAKQAGAVTWGNGVSATVGSVSSLNSLVGVSQGDRVGTIYPKALPGVIPLPNGNYVVATPSWSDWTTATVGVGAVTWCNGNIDGGMTGIVAPSNSLIGVAYTYEAGERGVRVLSNGNYVVESGYGSGGGTTYYAATWGNGALGGLIGTIGPANSLIGTSAYSSITPLSNGNFVFADAEWVNPAWVNPATGKTESRMVGAVMLAPGGTATTGYISAANALIGNGWGSPAYTGGAMAGVTALGDSNYVVCTSAWQANGNAGTPTSVGAVTWGDGVNGTKGVVSAANSITGSSSGDNICYMDSYPYQSIVPLSNGHYLIRSPHWVNNGSANAGAVTWVNGGAIETGAVTEDNSLVGSTANEKVGSNANPVTALGNGNYVLSNTKWVNGGAIPGAGSLTWGNGGAATAGVVSAQNSLVGEIVNDSVGSGGVMALRNGRYLAESPYWHSDPNTVVGAFTLGSGEDAYGGDVLPTNSVIGTAPNGGTTMNYAYDAPHDRLVVGRPASNIVTLFTLSDGHIFVDDFDGTDH